MGRLARCILTHFQLSFSNDGSKQKGTSSIDYASPVFRTVFLDIALYEPLVLVGSQEE